MSELRFDGVAVSYGRAQAVAPFTDEVRSGEWLALIGPNGAGKSSLLRAVAGLVRSTGDLTIDGRRLDGLRHRDRARLVAYVPQEPLIPDDMTVEEYVLLGRTPYLGPLMAPSRADRAIVAGVLDRLDLGALADRPLGALSGGERQRVVISRALAQQAPVLLLDEPTSALDIGHQQQALELVAELRAAGGLTVVSALHDLTLAATYADRLAMLHHGEVVAAGAATEVLTVERLAEVYAVSVSVDVEPDGTVIVVPRRRPPAPD